MQCVGRPRPARRAEEQQENTAGLGFDKSVYVTFRKFVYSKNVSIGRIFCNHRQIPKYTNPENSNSQDAAPVVCLAFPILFFPWGGIPKTEIRK